MSSYAISRRQGLMDFFTLIADILAPLWVFLTEERAKSNAAPAEAVPQPVAQAVPEPDDASDDDTQEIEVPIVTREEAMMATTAQPGTVEKLAVMATRAKAGQRMWHPNDAAGTVESELRDRLFYRRGEGKGVRYLPRVGGVKNPGQLYRRRKVGKRWVYEPVETAAGSRA